MTSERAVEARLYGDDLGEWEPSGTHADAYVDGWNAALAATRGEPPEPGPAIDVERLAALGHVPAGDGDMCLHRWRNRTTRAVRCRFLAGYRAAFPPVTEPADGPGETP